jgi:hypothetical protein
LSTLETVATETPAEAATLARVARRCLDATVVPSLLLR